ncbi:hypothetical protein EV702DRAFT_1195877 [Suillus placidus]|uniref:Uncharacterized protein n=1 Tax=Suillus placidus TaxID=48579 RepID=A0A9P6ZZ79_9AGAM|nr:hypothetical protein EV702DRAFT_1195877 [Suillus placidus]
MHFAALVALVVIASSVPGLAAPTPKPAISKRDDSSAVYGSPLNVDLYERSPGRVPDSVKAYPYERSPGRVLDSVTTQRDGDFIIQKLYPSKRSQTLPAGDAQGTGRNNNQGIASDTRRRSENNNWWDRPFIVRYPRVVLDSVTTKRDGDSIIQKLYPSKRSWTSPDMIWSWVSEYTSSNTSKRSQTLPAGDAQGTGSNNNQGIASDTRRRSGNNTISTWKVGGPGDL